LRSCSHPIQELTNNVFEKKASLPADVMCPYIFSDRPVNVRVTVFGSGPPGRIETRVNADGSTSVSGVLPPGAGRHYRIEVDDEAAGNKIRERLLRYSVENDGDAVDDREHKALWGRIEETLNRGGVSYEKVRGGQAILTREVIESLMELCRETDPVRRHSIRDLFSDKSVAKADRPFVVAWLLKEFEAEWRIDDQICVTLWTMATPAIADDLIRLIKDRRYEDQRWVLAWGWPKPRTREPPTSSHRFLAGNQHADGAGGIGQGAGAEVRPRIREFLKDPDSDVRREAKRTLKKLGFPVETPPPPVHLVKARRSVPKGLEEWSTNLDMEDLNPTLEKLAECVDSGFGKQEIAEVAGVADEMKVDQTRVFRFPVTTKAGSGEVWLGSSWMISTPRTWPSTPSRTSSGSSRSGCP